MAIDAELIVVEGATEAEIALKLPTSARDEAADVLWKAVTGNTSGNSAVEPAETHKKSPPQAEPAKGLNE